MTEEFPEFIRSLPEASIPIEGCKAYLFQGDNQQIIFMKFNQDAILPEHKHDCQWEIVLEGEVDVFIDKVKKRYHKGDRFFIQSNIPHSAVISAGYSSIIIFNQKDRYKIKK
jgi:quercetin dioxygenase-like cupin family protein